MTDEQLGDARATAESAIAAGAAGIAEVLARYNAAWERHAGDVYAQAGPQNQLLTSKFHPRYLKRALGRAFRRAGIDITDVEVRHGAQR